MGGDLARSRCRERIETLATAGLAADEARREAVAVLRRTIGFDRWCWPLADPDSALSVAGIGEVDFWPSLARMVALEEDGDVVSKDRLAGARRTSIALSSATDGDLARSRRWRECLEPYGVGDQLMTACRDRHGCWGWLELMRDAGDAPFDDHDARLLEDLAPALGGLLRRSAIRPWPADELGGLPRAPGTLILDEELQPVSWTSALRAWVDVLPSAWLYARFEVLPTAVYRLGARLLARDGGRGSALPASARVRTRTGRWCVIEGDTMEGAEAGRVAITIRAATPGETLDLLCRAYDLTARERELVALVVAGLSTRELAEALCISPYTVKDHLKAVFDKVGVRSRRELTTQLADGAPRERAATAIARAGVRASTAA